MGCGYSWPTLLHFPAPAHAWPCLHTRLPPHTSLQNDALHRLEGFASHHGPDFYGLPRNTGTVTLVREEEAIPEEYTFGGSSVVPMWAGQTLGWRVQSVDAGRGGA